MTVSTLNGFERDLRLLELHFYDTHPIPPMPGRFSVTATMYFTTIDGWDSISGEPIYVSTIAEVNEILEAEAITLVDGYRYEVYDHLLKRDHRSHRPYPRY